MNKIVLLPLSAGVALAPIISSCASTVYTFGYNFQNKTVEVPTKTIEFIPEGDITNFYFDQIYNNHQIVADDFAKGFMNILPADAKGTLNIELKENPKMVKHSLYITIAGSYTSDHVEYSFSVMYKHIPISITKDGTKYKVTTTLTGADDWKTIIIDNDTHISLTTSSIVGPTKESVTTNLSPKEAVDSYAPQWFECVKYLNFQSWYLSGE